MMIDLRGKAALITGAGSAGGLGFAAAKLMAAQGARLMTKTMAIECGRDRIRINSVHPGSIWTDMQLQAARENKAVFDQIEQAIPMGHLGQPEDIGAMVTFLASDDAKYITGAEFTVDGGLTAQ